MSGNILTLNAPMAPRLIRILYAIAIILIALGVLRGVAGGVMTMMRPPHQAAMAAQPGRNADQNAATTAQPPSTPQNAQANPMRQPGFGPGRFRRGPGMGGPRFMHRRRGPMMLGPVMRGMPPAVVGAVRILLVLLHGFILLLIVRVLAEIGIAILAMGTGADERGVIDRRRGLSG
jgi:hypothetical protein